MIEKVINITFFYDANDIFGLLLSIDLFKWFISRMNIPGLVPLLGNYDGGGNEDLGIDDVDFGKYEGDDRLKMQRYRKNNPSFCRIQG
jgi:hypothetical protein